MSLQLCAVIAVVVLFIGLGFVVVLKTQRAALWSGGLIAVSALGASLLVSLVDKTGYSEAQLAFLVNVYLVIAAVGANLFASAICQGLALSKPWARERQAAGQADDAK